MSHAQHMVPAEDAGNNRALVIAGWLTGIYFFVEMAVGVWTGSVAVISDAFHTFSAVGGVLIALVASRFSARPSTRFQTFGLIRAEIVGALVNGLFLLGMAVFIMWMGAMRLRDPVELSTGPMLAVATGGLITEVISLGMLYRRQKGNLNIKGAYWHIVQTFIGSLIIIVAAVTINLTGFLEIDPLLGMAFGVVLFIASFSIIRQSLDILLDNVPKDLDLNAVRDAVEALPHVESVHHLHGWSLTTGKNILSTHVLVTDFSHAEHVQQTIQSLVTKDFGVYFSTIQTETEICAAEDGAGDIDFLQRDPAIDHAAMGHAMPMPDSAGDPPSQQADTEVDHKSMGHAMPETDSSDDAPSSEHEPHH